MFAEPASDLDCKPAIAETKGMCKVDVASFVDHKAGRGKREILATRCNHPKPKPKAVGKAREDLDKVVDSLFKQKPAKEAAVKKAIKEVAKLPEVKEAISEKPAKQSPAVEPMLQEAAKPPQM